MSSFDKTATGTESRHSVTVPKTFAESALELLTRIGALDPTMQIKSDGEAITIAMARQLSDAEVARLSRLVPGANFAERFFQKRVKAPRTLEEALANRIPQLLLSDIPKSLDIVGDIAVFETIPSLSNYEKIIAEGIMEVQPSVRAVFAKAGTVSGEDRVRPLRHLTGENRTETIHREFGCRFKLDLSKVFFSPRLSTEHKRVADQVERGESVIDMFAGIGPFSILIAKKLSSVEVDAVDSNNHATKFIRENARLNRVSERVRVHNGDVRDVIEKELRQRANRVIMNHPSKSNEFLEAACNALQEPGGILHYYRFVDGGDWKEKIMSEFNNALNASGYRAERILEAHVVREVGPMNWQIVLDARVVKAS